MAGRSYPPPTERSHSCLRPRPFRGSGRLTRAAPHRQDGNNNGHFGGGIAAADSRLRDRQDGSAGHDRLCLARHGRRLHGRTRSGPLRVVSPQTPPRVVRDNQLSHLIEVPRRRPLINAIGRCIIGGTMDELCSRRGDVKHETIIRPNCKYGSLNGRSGPHRGYCRRFDDARKQSEDLARRERAIAERAAEIEKAQGDIDARVAAQLKAERGRVAQEEAKKAAETLAAEMANLRQQLEERGKRLDEAQRNELDLRRQRRDLEERQRQMQLEVDRKLDEERKQIRDAATKELAEEYRLKEAEKEQQLAAMRRQIDDLKRKAEQGSQQTQGEVLELELETLLAARFPSDTLEPVPKGMHGGDVLQRVHDGNGNTCGTIIWESKRTKAWSDGWLPKLRDDQREAQAELAALVTVAMPKDVSTFALIDGVWVTGGPCVVGLATALRASLIEAHTARQAQQGRQGKMEVLYAYLAGPQFRRRVEAIFESFTVLRDDLEQEKRAMQRIWAKREKQIDRVLSNTVGLHGDVAGIIGGSLPEIAAIELKALAAEVNVGDGDAS